MILVLDLAAAAGVDKACAIFDGNLFIYFYGLKNKLRLDTCQLVSILFLTE